jgi:hypothetical protein
MSRSKRELHLTEAERITLEQARDHHSKPYIRERAAALLRIGSGEAPYQVALTGVLKPRAPDTVYAWLNDYEQAGLGALYHSPRRKRDFPP